MTRDSLLFADFVFVVFLGGAMFWNRAASRLESLLRFLSLLALLGWVGCMSITVTIADFRDGAWTVLMLPFGKEIMLPHPYDYLLGFRLLPFLRLFLPLLGAICAAAYFWRRSEKRGSA